MLLCVASEWDSQPSNCPPLVQQWTRHSTLCEKDSVR